MNGEITRKGPGADASEHTRHCRVQLFVPHQPLQNEDRPVIIWVGDTVIIWGGVPVIMLEVDPVNIRGGDTVIIRGSDPVVIWGGDPVIIW